MKMIGVFIDISNIYYHVGKRFNKAKLDYSKYLEKAVGENILYKAIAYGMQTDNQAERFIKYLRSSEIEPKYKQHATYRNTRTDKVETRWSSWNVGIAVDVVRFIEKLDVVVLGSNDQDLIPLIQFIKEKGRQVVVFGTSIPKEVREAADVVLEISEELLESKNELPAESSVPSVPGELQRSDS